MDTSGAQSHIQRILVDSFDRGSGISTSVTDGAFNVTGESSATVSEPNLVVVKLDCSLSIVPGYGANGVVFFRHYSNVVACIKRSSRPKEPPLKPLTEPYVTVSHHTALPVQSK